MMDTTVAEEYLALRRDIAALKSALTRANETNDALRRRNEKLERHLHLVQTEIQRVGLVAAKDW